jgi:hypothetical protein
MRLIAGIVVALAILGVGAVILYLNYGTVAPCGILRERFRQQAIRDGGSFGGFVATALPDNVLDGMLAAQYGALTPGHCIDLLAHGEPLRGNGRAR